MSNTVLIVDDSSTMRRMVMASLQSLPDTAFQHAESGLEAIESLALNIPALVILDLNMPDIHGLEVLRFMRSHEQFRAVPVIVLTTRSDDESRDVAIHAGATRYLTKPFNPSALQAEVNALLTAVE